MTFKIIGAVLILISSGVMGSYFANVHNRRVMSTEEVAQFIRYVKRNIEAFSTPVNDILSSYSSEHFEKTGFLEAMRTAGLVEAICGGYLTLSCGAEKEFLEFASALGRDFMQGEVKRCEYYIALFDELAAAEKENKAQMNRMYRLLPPMGAISLIILLI